jgi:hypothetical protein
VIFSNSKQDLCMCRMIAFALLALALAAPSVADDDTTKKKLLPDLVLRAEPAEITIGGTCRLVSVIPDRCAIGEIISYSLHDVRFAARFDPEKQRMVDNGRPHCPIDPFPIDMFSALPIDSPGPHTPRFNVRDPDTKGFALDVKPRFVGCYLLTVAWTVMGDPKAPLETVRTLKSQPVILTVRPPKADLGRPIIKPEWLPTTARLYGQAFEDFENYTSPFPEDQHITDTSDPLSLEHAAELAAELSTLFLEVKKLTPKVARVLTTRANNEYPVYLSGVTALEGPDAVAVAEALASTPAPVVIKHLQRISAAALAALRKKATITLPPDEKLTIVP